MSTYEQTALWKRTLASRGDSDPHAKARERLRNAFQQTRHKVTPLIAKIGHELPMLTVHDITHIDSLWSVADMLMGEDYPINPAEAFVLGMAFLLHDAATSSFAYPGGIEGLRNTTQWRDFVAQRKFSEQELAQGQNGYKIALFETLRLLHPQQAEKLLDQTWTDSEGRSLRLLDDLEIVNAYGRHIGKVASSHGKDIAVSERAWANAPPLPPPPCIATYCKGENWTVDLLKLAMLLRCIDAAHIDSDRAPDFLAALNAPTGESRHHWSFQNKLSAINITLDNFVYWSGQVFEEKDSEAWWRCYDAFAMIDREIRNANKILAQNGRHALRAQGVLGANDVNELRKHVPTQGWYPLDIRYQVSKIGTVIEKFGGTALYGDKPYLALRELLQNAVDAIHARRLHRNSVMTGLIEVALEERDGSCWLHVTDDGIGMSRYVLTEVLLDFGRSLWSDSALREQWQGLAAKGFESIGQFGIGFFSVFMLGDEVKVTTWRDGDAESEQATLHIRDRVHARPILLETSQQERLQQVGTRVSVRLREGREGLLPVYETRRYGLDADPRRATLHELAGMLAPSVDVDIKTMDGDAPAQICVNADDWRTIANDVLMQRIAPASTEKAWSRFAENMFPVRELDGELVGRISFLGISNAGIGLRAGVSVHQGLLTGWHDFSGVLLSQNNAGLARSESRPIASSYAMRAFAEASLDAHLEDMKWQCRRFLSLGVDYRQLALGMVDEVEVNAEQIADIAYRQYQEYGQVIMMLGLPDCPDWISQDDFTAEFEYLPGIIQPWTSYLYSGREKFNLGDYMETLFPTDQHTPRTPSAAVIKVIEDACPGCEIIDPDDGYVVGIVRGEEISVDCLIFSRPIPEDDDKPPAS
jgi:Histidine kinase-, DNA gyrase B-, and HSP90-like ATPase